MPYYIEILLFLTAISTSLCSLSGLNKPLRQSFYKSDPDCQEVKCPAVSDPICVRMTYVTPTLKPKSVYVVMLNKCELKYVRCHQGVQAFEKPMEYCDHGLTKNKTEMKKRIKRNAVEPPVNGTTVAQIEVMANNNSATPKTLVASKSNPKEAKKRPIPKKKLNNTNKPSKVAKIAKKTVSKKKRKLQSKTKLGATVKTPKLPAPMPTKKRAEGSDLETDKKLDGENDEDAPKSDIDEKGQLFVPAKNNPESDRDGFGDGNPESDKDGGSGQYFDPGEHGTTIGAVESDGNGPVAGSDLDGGGQYYEPPDDVPPAGPEDDHDDGSGGVVTKDDVNMQEYSAACPSVCPARTMMLCAMCKDGIYRTFMSVCHMRQFHCHHPDEKLALVSRKPCVMSAPYVQNGSPQGILEEFDDEDTVLRWFRCKETNQQKPVYWSKLNCNFN